jgi:hypothetical protein
LINTGLGNLCTAFNHILSTVDIITHVHVTSTFSNLETSVHIATIFIVAIFVSGFPDIVGCPVDNLTDVLSNVPPSTQSLEFDVFS